jgi:hypothetical protein
LFPNGRHCIRRARSALAEPHRQFDVLGEWRGQARASGDRTIQLFMQEALPEASEATRALAGDLITTTFSAVGKEFSESPRTQAEIDIYAEAMADMFCAYLKSLRHR